MTTKAIWYTLCSVIPAYSSWQCFQTVHIIAFVIITPTAGILTLTIAMDRVICVVSPLSYRMLGPKYVLGMTLAVYGPVVPVMILCATTTKLYRGDEPKVCVLALPDVPSCR